MRKELSEVINAVQENVDGSWSSWDSAEHICEIYDIDITLLTKEEIVLIEDAIRTNGEILTVETIQRFGLNG